MLLLSFSLAFAGNGINYQAVARNAAGQPLTNIDVALKFTIREGSATGGIA